MRGVLLFKIWIKCSKRNLMSHVFEWFGRWQHEPASTISSTSWASLSLRHPIVVHWPDYATAGDSIMLTRCPSVESSSNRMLAFHRGFRLGCFMIRDTILGSMSSGSVNFGLLIRTLRGQMPAPPRYRLSKALNPLTAQLKCKDESACEINKWKWWFTSLNILNWIKLQRLCFTCICMTLLIAL